MYEYVPYYTKLQGKEKKWDGKDGFRCGQAASWRELGRAEWTREVTCSTLTQSCFFRAFFGFFFPGWFMDEMLREGCHVDTSRKSLYWVRL
jgi:hypothetical protein